MPGPGLNGLDILRLRPPQVLEPDLDNPRQSRVLALHQRHEFLDRIPAVRVQKVDLVFNSLGHHEFATKRQTAEENDGQSNHRAAEQKHHEKSALREELVNGLE
jgi:hypothetical protein